MRCRRKARGSARRRAVVVVVVDITIVDLFCWAGRTRDSRAVFGDVDVDDDDDADGVVSIDAAVAGV